MLSVPEVARRVGKDPETIRRWIRSGKLRARKIGTQHMVEEADLASVTGTGAHPMPREWRKTWTGEPQPNWVRMLQRSRREH